MADKRAPTKRCEFEPGFYPIDAFIYDPAWGWIHKVTPRHNTDGDVIPDKDVGRRHQGQPPAEMAAARPRKKQRTPPAAPITS